MKKAYHRFHPVARAAVAGAVPTPAQPPVGAAAGVGVAVGDVPGLTSIRAAAGVGIGGSGDRRAYPYLSVPERRATFGGKADMGGA
jgi:hypothetical protein